MATTLTPLQGLRMPENSSSKDPTLRFEHEAARLGFTYLIGCDEVGRGAIAGPVGVGIFAVRCDVESFPEGLRDSKLLSEKKREAILPAVQEWGEASTVGFASAQEIDQHGITAMLGEAARRGLLALHDMGIPVQQSLVLLDGSHDWISPALKSPLNIRTQVKADRDCATVAAASVLAKVQRDELMRALHAEHDHFGWQRNKGYGSAAHYEAIRQHGLTSWHRASWIRA